MSGKTVLASSQSHTSVGLFKVLCKVRYGVAPRFATGSCSEHIEGHELPDACLAIGDEALRLCRSGLFPYVLDLGAAWFEWTGLPFVFAVWVIRKETAADRNAEVQRAIEALLSSRRWGCANIGRICERAAESGVLGLPELEEYYRCLRFNLDERERKGLELFYSYLFQIGELEQAPMLDIYTPLASVA
jgi:chorismate dehydratase